MFVFSGKRLRAIRERSGLSREQLAVAAHLSASSITSLECGIRGPSRTALLRLADALGVAPRDLVDDDPIFAKAGR